MNTWEDAAVIAEVNGIGKPRIVLAGLWTSVCIVGPALSALDQGFEVYVIADACGDVSTEAHDRAMERMVQAGARPMTSLQYLLELQRDWARSDDLRRDHRRRREVRRRLRPRHHLRQGDVRRRRRPLISSCMQQAPTAAIDTLCFNGRFTTLDRAAPEAEAVAIANGVLLRGRRRPS